MNRERVLKVALVLVGLLFAAAILPTIGGLQDPAHSDTGDTMQMAMYFVLGIFLLSAVRNPAKHRSLIGYAAWSSIAHAVVMTTLGFELPPQKSGFIGGSVVLVVIAILLLVLRPGPESSRTASSNNPTWSSDITASPLPPSA
jgi:peptidoglycan/LPS O-acetylase OafA/YrhL